MNEEESKYKIECTKCEVVEPVEKEMNLEEISTETGVKLCTSTIDEEHPNKEFRGVFTIACDDDDDNNSFNIEYFGSEDMVIDRNRCEIGVYIKENKTPYNRHYFIKCIHSNDRTVFTEIEIIQEHGEFSIEVANSGNSKKNTYKIECGCKEESSGEQGEENETTEEKEEDYNFVYELDSIVDKQMVTFNINVVGGSEKYRIEAIYRCCDEEVGTGDDAKTITKLYDFDNGFVYDRKTEIVNKEESSGEQGEENETTEEKSVEQKKLEIYNYGRPFLEENDYYLMKIRHEDYKELFINIVLKYKPVSAAKKRGRKSTKNQSKVVRITNNCLTHGEYVHMLESQKEQEIVEVPKTYKIEVHSLESNSFVIEGKKVGVVIPFDVLEDDNIERTLYVSYSATSNWCSVYTDETNRQLILNILNRPIVERKCLVTLKVVDFPKASCNFVVINRP